MACVLARGQTENLHTLFSSCPSQIPNWLLTRLTETEYSLEMCSQCPYFSAARISPALNTFPFLLKRNSFLFNYYVYKKERKTETETAWVHHGVHLVAVSAQLPGTGSVLACGMRIKLCQQPWQQEPLPNKPS